MAATHSYSYLSNLGSNFRFPIHYFHSQAHTPMFSFCCFLLSFVSFSLLVFSFSLYKRLKKRETELLPEPTHQTQTPNWSDPPGTEPNKPCENDSAHLTRSARSLLLEILPSDSPKWESLFEAEKGDLDSVPFGSVLGEERGESGGDPKGKKKKRRAKKKNANSKVDEDNGVDEGNSGSGCRGKEELVCLYPFTSSSSLTQRKIKQQYDELMKCHHSKGLTLAQVGQFANCLVEAKNELQHKADVIQRKFTITKALLFKADRSSFDRLRQQIYKLELEQKRLEEDAFVYNWLQQQLKLSPAYKKMLEIGARMEMKAKAQELMESTDTECSDITFEELLAQEKKDSFWLRNGKLRPCSG